MSAHSAISKMVHEHNHLPIEMVCLAICGTTGHSDVQDSYSDASWRLRHRAYDDMSPDEVRAAARAARQHNNQTGGGDVMCAAFALIANQSTPLYNRLSQGLQRAAQASRKRRIDALRQDSDSEDIGVFDAAQAANPVDARSDDAVDGGVHDFDAVGLGEDADNSFLEFFGC
jgi:hypothetical protein